MKEKLFGEEIVQRWRALLRAQHLSDRRDIELGEFGPVAEKLFKEDPDLAICFGSFECFWHELGTGNGYSDVFSQWAIPPSCQGEWNALMLQVQRSQIARRLVITAKNRLVALMSEKAEELTRSGLLPVITPQDGKHVTESELDQQLHNITQPDSFTASATDSEISELSHSATEDSIQAEPTPDNTNHESQQ